MKILTSSSLSTFRDCPRRYFYKYELQRVRVTVSAALAFGKAWHRIMEAYWKGVELAPDALDGTSDEDTAKLYALLAYYAPPRNSFDILGVEESFTVPIRRAPGSRAFYAYRLAGKVDVRMARKSDGALLIMDHKTTASEIIGFGPFWEALQIDGQMGNYCLAMGASAFVYDVVRKPTIRMCGKDAAMARHLNITDAQAYQQRCELDIKASPETFYQFRTVTKLGDDMAEAAADLWQQTEMFHSCERAGRWPRNCNACVGRYGACPYIQVCAGRARIDDDAEFRTTAAEHEELEVA